MQEIVLNSTLTNIDKIGEFVEAFLSDKTDNIKFLTQINVVIDEVFSNIVNYGYKNPDGLVTIRVDYADGIFSLIFIDSAKKFDPTASDDPDVTLSAEDRDIGGLGIFLVKRIMDTVEYQYIDNQNVLTLKKKLN